MKKLLAITAALCLCTLSWGQKFPERRIVRSGNNQYEKGNYVEAEVSYRRALEKNQGAYEAADNLAKSLYKQERWDESAKFFGALAADTLHAPYAAAAYYDLGNAMFQQRKLQEALEAYKQSLRINPGDMEAKFNLAYVQKLLENQQGDGGGGNDKNQDNKDNKDNQGDNKQDRQQQGQQPEQGEGDNKDKPEPQHSDADQNAGMSREEADRMLEAVQMSEDKTREKKDAEKAKAVAPAGGKNW